MITTFWGEGNLMCHGGRENLLAFEFVGLHVDMVKCSP